MKITTYKTQAAQNAAWYKAIKQKQKRNETIKALALPTLAIIIFIYVLFTTY